MKSGLKSVVLTILNLSVKVAIIAAAVLLVSKGSITAYSYGYKIFEDAPYEAAPGKSVTVSITKGKDAKAIGKILEDNKLIEDGTLFYIQNLLSHYKGKLQPGTYTLNSSMTATEMMMVISGETSEEDSENLDGNATVPAEDAENETDASDTEDEGEDE